MRGPVRIPVEGPFPMVVQAADTLGVGMDLMLEDLQASDRSDDHVRIDRISGVIAKRFAIERMIGGDKLLITAIAAILCGSFAEDAPINDRINLAARIALAE